MNFQVNQPLSIVFAFTLSCHPTLSQHSFILFVYFIKKCVDILILLRFMSAPSIYLAWKKKRTNFERIDENKILAAFVCAKQYAKAVCDVKNDQETPVSDVDSSKVSTLKMISKWKWKQKYQNVDTLIIVCSLISISLDYIGQKTIFFSQMHEKIILICNSTPILTQILCTTCVCRNKWSRMRDFILDISSRINSIICHFCQQIALFSFNQTKQL